jgi:hypothetical protein
MPEVELQEHVSAEPSPVIPDGRKPAAPVTGHSAFAGLAHRREHDLMDYGEALEDAERLLKYAAESGVAVDDATRDSILEARATGRDKWNEKTVANLLAALTKLAAELKPVTAESLRNFNAEPTVLKYWIVAIVLAVLIVPYSVASFVASNMSQTIQSEVATANELALKLDNELLAGGELNVQAGSSASQAPAPAGSSVPAPGVSPAEVGTELQTFASTIRAIYAQAGQLNRFIFDAVDDPYASANRTTYRDSFELPVPLLQTQFGVQASKRIRFYQDVRFFGNTVVSDVSVFYGAVAACILPVLYALLGACAYLLRCFSLQMKSRTFVKSRSDSPRFLIAAIGGAMVGFFSRLAFGQDTSLSPLAIAFLIGYAVDIFFSFLDGLIQAFAKGKINNAADAREA